MYKKLTALSMALGLTLLAAGCSSNDDEAAPSPESSQSQKAAAPQEGGADFSAAPEGTDTGGWDSEKYPERVGTSSKDFLLSTEYGVWAAGQAWYIAGGTWEKGAIINITVAGVPEGEMDAAALEESSEGAESSFTVTAGDDGTFDAAVHVPEDTAPGSYVITASNDETGIGQGQIIQVVAPE